MTDPAADEPRIEAAAEEVAMEMDGIDPDLAAQMGFTSFGAVPRAPKKRRLDAVVAAPASAPAPAPKPPGANPDEISLDDDDDDDDQDEPLTSSSPALPERSTTTATAPATHPLPPRPSAPPSLQSAAGADAASRQHPQEKHRAPLSAKRPDGSWNWAALRQGVRDAHGDVAYYEPSFVEDPWAKLLPDSEAAPAAAASSLQT